MNKLLNVYIVVVALIALWEANNVQGQRPNTQNVGAGDISSHIGNKNLVEKQIKCVLDKGPCDRTGKQIKMYIPEVLQRNCRACNKQQAANARRLISFIQKNYPTEWQQINAKYKG